MTRYAAQFVWVAAVLTASLFLVACPRREGGLPTRLPSSWEGENCLACHSGMSGFSPGHDPAEIGCAVCHQGQTSARTADGAHRGMLQMPGQLASAGVSCSATGCHPGIDLRVKTSLMHTLRGVVGVDRWVFGEAATPDGTTDVQDLGHTPADTHLRNLCASCHLGAPKMETGPVTEGTRGGGCLACHLHYSAAAKEAWVTEVVPSVHPRLSLPVDNDPCFGCHSRSGRISTNYEGWHETLQDTASVVGRRGFRIMEDERVFRWISPDVHHESGLACIDCHDHLEVMGDGKTWFHKEEAVQVRCRDCHFDTAPTVRVFEELDPVDQRLLRLRGREVPGRSYVLGAESGRPLLNVHLEANGSAVFTGKRSGKQMPLSAPATDCRRDGVHRDLHCSACHTAWAPQCISCHTRYRPDVPGYDLLADREVSGRWDEQAGEFLAELPPLGVVEQGTERRIQTFVPGMLLDLAPGMSSEEPAAPASFHRLHAPTEAHTIRRQGRSCVSCHRSSLALGVGRGTLTLQAVEGRPRWHFEPAYPLRPEDGWPRDAWTGWMESHPGPHSTRTRARPFSPDEQRRILRVGACLTCHEEAGPVMIRALTQWESIRSGQGASCLDPGVMNRTKER